MLTPSQITDNVAAAFGRNIQDFIFGNIALNEDGSNPSDIPYTVPVKVEGQEETYFAYWSPFIDATKLSDNTRVKMIYERDGNLTIIDADDVAARDSYPNPPPRSFVLSQHNHSSPEQGGKLNIANAVDSGVLAQTYGGTGANLSASSVGSIFYQNAFMQFTALADVATGNVLRSGGVGVAPAYGKVVMTTDITGITPVANGGTGKSSNTTGVLLLGAGASAMTELAPGTSGNLAQSNGTIWTSAAPSFAASVITSGVLAYARGGLNTDVSALTNGSVVIKGAANATGVAPGTDGQVLTVVAGAWASAAAGAGSSPFTTTSNVTHLVTPTDTVTIGSSSNLGKLAVVGDADEMQFLVRAHGLQSGNIMSVEDVGGTVYFAIDAVGGFRVNVSQTSTASFQAYGDNDSSLFATAPSSDRVGVGISSPDSRFEVRGRADEIQTIIRANGTQTSDIFRITTSAPATLLSVTNGGKLFLSDEIEIDGALNHDGSTVGFYGTTPISLQAQTVDLKDAIVALGLVSSSGGATPLNLDSGALTAGNTVIGGTFTQDGGAVVFNEAGADQDFRIEGDTDPDLLKVDAGLDMIGVSEPTPSSLLHIGASTTGRGSLGITEGTAPTGGALVNGTTWHDSTQKAFKKRINGLSLVDEQTLFSQITTVSVSGTISETSLIGTIVLAGNDTLPANFWTVGKSFTYYMGGLVSVSSGTPTATFRIKYGSTALRQFTTPTLSGSNIPWFLTGVSICRAVGASGSIFSIANLITNGANTPGLTNATIDTTSSNAIDVTVQPSTTAVTWTCTDLLIVIHN